MDFHLIRLDRDETMARQVIQFGSFSFDAKQNVRKGRLNFIVELFLVEPPLVKP